MINDQENQPKLSPEERTELFFAQPSVELAKQLIGMKIHARGGIIVIDRAEHYPSDKNSNVIYDPVRSMKRGKLWNRPFEMGSQRGEKHTNLSLIATCDEQGDSGSCIQIQKARRIDTDAGKIVPVKTQRDLALLLGVPEFHTAQLGFVDDTDTLHVLYDEPMVPESSEANAPEVSPTQMLADLFQD